MTEPMTEGRFRMLAGAYGGTIARWPDAERAPALLLAGRPELRTILAEAEALDARLDGWRIEAPSPALRAAVLRGQRRSWRRRAGLWWSGLGLAASLAGAAAGSVAAAAVLPADHGAAEETTAFGNLGGQEE